MRSGIRVVGVVLLTAALAWLGLYTGRGAGRVPAVWWANGAMVSIMLLDCSQARSWWLRGSSTGRGLVHLLCGEGRRNWPLFLSAGYGGNLLAHLLVGDPLFRTFALSACDIGEVALAVYSVRFAIQDSVDLTEQSQLLRFVGCAVLMAPLVASVAAGLVLRRLAGGGMAVSLRWFPPNALGMSIVPPLVLGLARQETRELFERRKLGRTLAFLGTIVLMTAAIFSRSHFALLFLLIPPLLFLVLRLGVSGGALGCCAVAAVGTDFTVGPHSGAMIRLDPSLEHRILMLQMFLATAVLSVSVVGVVLADLRRAATKVQESEVRYRSLAASMEMLATLDPLTQLANRRRFDEALETEWQRAMRRRMPLSLLLFDADYFKAYNDHYGHPAGDECLKKIAMAMQVVARRPADLVARLGGEEFGIVLPETPAEGALALAENLCRRIEELGFRHAASPMGVMTISGGCATVVPCVGHSLADLVHSADVALYEAKRRGRNRVEMAPRLAKDCGEQQTHPSGAA